MSQLSCSSVRRHHDRADDDDHQYGRTVISTKDLLREGHRHIPRHVLRVRLRRVARVCCGQLYVLGREGQAEGETTEGAETTLRVRISGENSLGDVAYMIELRHVDVRRL